MKRILIAVDYDPLAEKVANTGYQLSQALGGEVILLHVIKEPSYYASELYSPIMGFTGFEDPATFEVMKEIEKEAYRFLEKSRTHLGNESIEIAVMDGEFDEAIINAVEKYNADMIVIGTHSRKGLNKFFVGNLAEEILNKVSVPVLVVPEDKS